MDDKLLEKLISKVDRMHSEKEINFENAAYLIAIATKLQENNNDQHPVSDSEAEVCYCGKAAKEGYSPCCSYDCWHHKFE